jgi:hypothetical protein
MMFRAHPAPVLAISQPSHAWVAGQILRAWARPLDEALLLAADQHDIAWLDWERAPSFDPKTGRPHSFRALSPAIHAPMWTIGIERALAAWGMRVALLVSRHGALLYTRFADPARMSPADAEAVESFLRQQRPLQCQWAGALGLTEATLAHDTGMIAMADALSLALCGDLKMPLEVQAPDGQGGEQTLRLAAHAEAADRFTLSPWPLRVPSLLLEAEAIPLPASGHFSDAAAMRAWHEQARRVVFTLRLEPVQD